MNSLAGRAIVVFDKLRLSQRILRHQSGVEKGKGWEWVLDGDTASKERSADGIWGMGGMGMGIGDTCGAPFA